MKHNIARGDAGLHLLEARESGARTYARTINRMLERGNFARVWDTDGTEYIDCLSCAGALPLGHNHPFVTRRVQEFFASGHVQQGLDIPTVAKVEFVERLLQALPRPFADEAKLQFCGPSGSDAVEAAIKLFKTATGRRGVLTFHGAYHGMTMGSLSLMGNTGPKQNVAGYMSEVQFLPYPYAYRCPFGIGGAATEQLSINYIENLLTDPESGVCKPAMIILEVIQGEGGCIPASATWLMRIREITEWLEIPLVIDEVQTGFGRTGTMFAHEIAGIVPDAIIMSKAIGGGFPLSVLAYRERFDKWTAGAHAGTFRGNQIALVAGSATMEYLMENDIAEEAAKKGTLLKSLLISLATRYRCIGDIRGRGLMVGIEIVDLAGQPDRLGHCPPSGELAKQIKIACLENGLIIETGGRYGSVVRFLPPLIITDEEIRDAVAKLESALDRIIGDSMQVAA